MYSTDNQGHDPVVARLLRHLLCSRNSALRTIKSSEFHHTTGNDFGVVVDVEQPATSWESKLRRTLSFVIWLRRSLLKLSRGHAAQTTTATVMFATARRNKLWHRDPAPRLDRPKPGNQSCTCRSTSPAGTPARQLLHRHTPAPVPAASKQRRASSKQHTGQDVLADWG